MIKKRFIKGDCLEHLPRINNVQCIITDPPYNINWKYSKEFKDNREDYHEWCLKWAELCIETLNDKGVLCIINYPENNNLLYVKLIEKGYNFVQQLIWTYHTNIGHSRKKYTRSYRTILILSKTKDYYFNPAKGEYKNPTDKRIRERINNGFSPIHYDVFNINLCKNISKNKNKIGINQLPVELVRLLIESYSKPNDIVLDPFVGTGTVMDLAHDMSREAVGIDVNDYSKTKRIQVK